MNKQQIDKLLQFIDESQNIVFFGGAGVSTESGIPDFRSKNGLYNQHDVQFEKYSPEYLLSHSCLYNNPKVFYEFYRQKLDTRGIEPNITHTALMKMEEKGKLKAVITQNIDGLHQMAGSKEVYEIHGTTQVNYCVKCGKRYPTDYIFECGEDIPRCDCEWHGMIRPDVTLYEENLPDVTVNKALKALNEADMLIVAGTSLTVYPAASFIRHFYGKHIVVINLEKPENISLDKENDLFIQGNMSEAFAAILKHISK